MIISTLSPFPYPRLAGSLSRGQSGTESDGLIRALIFWHIPHHNDLNCLGSMHREIQNFCHLIKSQLFP